MTILRSRDNPRVRRWARLVLDGRFRRQEGRILLEGPHLVAAALERGLKPIAVLVSESSPAEPEIASLLGRAGMAPQLLSESAFRAVADADEPPGIAGEFDLPRIAERRGAHCVFLERVQDPGNVGAIVRSAAAFGVGAVVLDRGCADAWSPKALRAGMGGHFMLAIRQTAALGSELDAFDGKVACALTRGGTCLASADLSGRLGWVFGSEGGGLSPRLAEKARLRVTIPTAPGTESLNVAAAAAICLYESFRRA